MRTHPSAPCVCRTGTRRTNTWCACADRRSTHSSARENRDRTAARPRLLLRGPRRAAALPLAPCIRRRSPVRTPTTISFSYLACPFLLAQTTDALEPPHAADAADRVGTTADGDPRDL